MAAAPATVGLGPERAGDDGWYRTGDLARRDQDGYVSFVGRRDDVFKSGGHRASPPEVERALMGHPAVLEAAVVAFGDPQLGTVAKAFVHLAPGMTADATTAAQICRHAAGSLLEHALPRRVRFGPLPRTMSQKVSRADLCALTGGPDFAVPVDDDGGLML